MTDMPKVRKATLAAVSRELLTATEAVQEGIATHAEKHTASRRAAHARLEETRKLARNIKAS